MGTQREDRWRRGLVFEPLESRLLLSADLVPFDASLVAEPLPPVPAVYRALAAGDATPRFAMRFEAPAREMVFVDGGIADHAQLLADFLRAAGGERAIDVVVLDPERDGVAQIGEALAARRGLAAVHVLSHGRDGAVELGATTLDSGALAARAETIGRWAQAFAADGDILFYGCELAASADGEAFLAGLAALTGADVAASSDLTGSGALGGDWDLEFATGAIEAALWPLGAAEASWAGLLARLDWDDPAIDWPAASLGPHSFAVGGGTVTIQVQTNLLPASTTTINNGSPDDDALVDQGGLPVPEQGLYVSSSGFQPGEWALITIDFSHPGGVSDVSFTIFDIDLGTFTDEVQAAYTASGPVALTIADSLNNDLVAADTVRGIAGTPSTGLPDSGNANATFSFAGSGITQIALTYRNAGGASGQSITLHDIDFNVTPVAIDDAHALGEDGTLNVAAAAGVLGNDSDVDGPALSAVLVSGPANASAFTLNADGSFSYTPTADWNGVDTFTYRATDGTAQSATATVTIAVAAVGDAAGDAVATAEDAPVTLNVLANDSFENPGRTLTGVAGAVNGTVGFTPLGAITYAPNANWNGSEILTYTVASGGVTETATLTITVDAVNDEPSFTIAGDQTVAEDSGPHTVAGFASPAPGGGPDEAVQTFTYAVTNGNNALFAVQPSIAANGSLAYVLAPDVAGVATVTVSLVDSGGTANGGDDTAPAQAFTITVTPVADAPSLTVAPAAGNEDGAIPLAVTASLVDADGSETLALSVAGIPVGAMLSDGAASFTAAAGSQTADVTGWNLAALSILPPAHSDADFTLTVSAISTETANGFSATASLPLAITVDPVADAPTLGVAPATGNEDTAIALVIAAALVDTDGSEALALELDAVPVGAVVSDGANSFTASAGSQLVDISGWNLAALTVTPPADSDGDFPLTVRAISSEAGGGTATAVATLAVDVVPVNDAPTVAAPAALGVIEDVPSPLTGIVFADPDAGGNPVVTATFTVARGTLSAVAGGGVVVGGTATALTLTGSLADINTLIAAGNLSYATALDDTAPVVLTASVDDLGNAGAGGPLASPGANVALTVTPVNDAPAFGNLMLAVAPGGTVVLSSASLSATDVDDAWANLVFFIGSLQNGFFELAGNPGVPITSFTQGQVGAGAVHFVQTDPFGAPSFVVFVTDGTAVAGPAAVGIAFSASVGVVPAPGAGGNAGALPVVSFAATALGTANDQPGAPFGIHFARAPIAPASDGSPRTEDQPVSAAAGSRQGAARQPVGALAQLRLDVAGDRLPTAVPKVDFTVRPERHDATPRSFGLNLDSVRSAGLAVSVGAAWWAGRASALLGSLLASAPTWRHIDPLPVLARARDDKHAGWGEARAEDEKRDEAAARDMFGGAPDQPRRG